MKSNTIVFCKQFFVSSFKRVSFRWRITKQNTNKTVNNGLLLQQIRSFNLKTKTNWIGVFFQYVTIKYHSGAPRLAKCLGIIPIAIEICTIRLYLSRHCSKWYMNERKRKKREMARKFHNHMALHVVAMFLVWFRFENIFMGTVLACGFSSLYRVQYANPAKPFKSRCITIIANCRQFKTIAYTFQIRTQFFVSLGVIVVQVHALIRTRKSNATGEKRNENCCFNWIHSEWFASFFYFCVPWIESAYKTLCKKMVTNIHFFSFSQNEINWRQWPWLLGWIEKMHPVLMISNARWKIDLIPIVMRMLFI